MEALHCLPWTFLGYRQVHSKVEISGEFGGMSLISNHELQLESYHIVCAISFGNRVVQPVTPREDRNLTPKQPWASPDPGIVFMFAWV